MRNRLLVVVMVRWRLCEQVLAGFCVGFLLVDYHKTDVAVLLVVLLLLLTVLEQGLVVLGGL